MLQRKIFLAGEGAAWLERNRDKLGQHDPVSELIEAQGIVPKSVLEIGAADGWRLRKLEAKYGCRTLGIDPAAEDEDNYLAACVHWERGCSAKVFRGTAENIPPLYRECDLVIFGFCLYLCDPCDYFRIVEESDHVLQDGGHLIIHDFEPPNDHRAERVPYAHKHGVWSHHLDFSRLWTAHPAYQLAGEWCGQGGDLVVLLRKSMKDAFRDGQET